MDKLETETINNQINAWITKLDRLRDKIFASYKSNSSEDLADARNLYLVCLKMSHNFIIKLSKNRPLLKQILDKNCYLLSNISIRNHLVHFEDKTPKDFIVPTPTRIGGLCAAPGAKVNIALANFITESPSGVTIEIISGKFRWNFANDHNKYINILSEIQNTIK